MRVLLLCLALLPGLATAADADPERSRLADQRRAIEQRFMAEQAACESRFAVTACIEAARLRRRDALVALQHQESALQRRERAAEVEQRRQAIAARAAVAPASAAVAPAAPAAATPVAREQDPAASAAADRRPKPRLAPVVPDRSAQEARARAAYERRQHEAAEHRRKVEARRAAQAASGARTGAPLPAPAASPAQR